MGHFGICHKNLVCDQRVSDDQVCFKSDETRIGQGHASHDLFLLLIYNYAANMVAVLPWLTA